MLLRVAHAKRGVAGLARLGLAVGLAATLVGVLAAACAKPAADSIDLTWALRPERPTIGPATLTVTLGEPHAAASGTRVRVVGHMTHPGMRPVEAEATRCGHGVYQADLTFTMAGDWALLVTIELADGRRVERRIDVPGVRDVPVGAPPALGAPRPSGAPSGT
jgi:hypothetical protein